MPCETRGQTTVPLSDPFFFFGDLKLLIVVPPHSLMMTSENKHICKKIHHFKSTYIKFLLYTINDCLYIVHVLNLNLTSQIVPVYKWLAIQMKNCWEDFSFYTLVNWKLISELVFIKSFFFFFSKRNQTPPMDIPSNYQHHSGNYKIQSNHLWVPKSGSWTTWRFSPKTEWI